MLSCSGMFFSSLFSDLTLRVRDGPEWLVPAWQQPQSLLLLPSEMGRCHLHGEDGEVPASCPRDPALLSLCPPWHSLR